MKYVALLRGINVGGNNTVKMAELRTHMEKAGMQNVLTYINSGNVIFETNEKDKKQLVEKLEELVENKFKVNSKILLKTPAEIEEVVKAVPTEWHTQKDLRCYIGFLFDSISVADAQKAIVPKPGVDKLKTGPGVVYMTTLISERTKSAFNKLVGTKIYSEMTIRNLNTTRKIFSLLNSD